MSDRTHPLAALAAQSARCPAVQLAPLPPNTRLIIRGDAGTLASIGLTVPQTCQAITFADNALLWLGPDEFMLLAADGKIPAPANSVDVSHRDTSLAVTGPRAAWVINAHCALDLHSSAFPVGMCTRTILGKAEVVLWRTAPETFRVEVARSFAPYVWACLEEARREFLE